MLNRILNCLVAALEIAAAIFILVSACEIFGFKWDETGILVLALVIGYLVFWD